MFAPHKNSFLQLACAMNPRLINKAVDLAMGYVYDPHDAEPAAQRLSSMQPSLFAPHVDITRAQVGFEQIGLKILVRELSSQNHLTRLRALHSIMDKVQVSEHALVMLKINVVFRLADLLHNRNPVIREKVCITLSHLTTYHTGRRQMLTHPLIIEDIMWLILRDRKEIRYAAANTLKELSRDTCACEVICRVDNIIENLLKMVVNEHVGIVLLHLATLAQLIAWDQVEPLKCNAFQIMLALFRHEHPRVVQGAMECTAQLLAHDVGRELADRHDLLHALRPFLLTRHRNVVVSATALMAACTITERSKWRAREFCADLTDKLMRLAQGSSPVVKLSCLQTLVNLCDSPDVRHHMLRHYDRKVRNMYIRTDEEWDGTSETTSYGLETGHNYRTVCIEKVETIRNELGDNEKVVNVHSYLRTLREKKEQLIKAINWKSYRD